MKQKKKMTTLQIILIAAVVAVFGLIFWYFGTKNSLVTLQETVNSSWAQVENQMQRRIDLIPNLVNTVKGYAIHEKTVFTDIANARAKLSGATNINSKIKAYNGIESALSRLLMIVENYPQLKANESFNRLMDELAGTENRIAVERKRYNENVRIYNQKIRMVPTSIVAKMAGFTKINYFKITEKAKEVPTVKF
ncbi:MAG: LemA family protein [Candidatus Margulisiibacteriota bacterium]|jgi:LemA protein